MAEYYTNWKTGKWEEVKPMKHLFWATVCIGAALILALGVCNITRFDMHNNQVYKTYDRRKTYEHYEKGAVGLLVKDADDALIKDCVIGSR